MRKEQTHEEPIRHRWDAADNLYVDVQAIEMDLMKDIRAAFAEAKERLQPVRQRTLQAVREQQATKEQAA